MDHREKIAAFLGLALATFFVVAGVAISRWGPKFTLQVGRATPTPPTSVSPSSSPAMTATPTAWVSPPPTPDKPARPKRTYKGSNPPTPKLLEVKSVGRADGGKVYGTNLSNAELTLHLDLTTSQNVGSNPPVPYVTTLGPKEKRLLVDVSQRDYYQPWRFNYEFFYTFGSAKAQHDENWVYSLPFEAGTSQPLLANFLGGYPIYVFEMEEDTPVHCSRSGKVVYTEARYSQRSTESDAVLRTNRVLIRHDDGTHGSYSHLRPQGVTVRVGEWVDTGSLIGYSGQTGNCSGPMLAFQVFRGGDGKSIQSFPLQFLTSDSDDPVSLEPGRSYTATEN
jgi:murein DD-endopeptidase MepM/ murein hydrolase activator NlpD